MILEVRIKAPPGGTSRTLQFAKSPVRIGRNQLNDISLDDPFVSEWHGTIRFDEHSIAYFDLGSTNGTLLDGKRLAKNVASELSVASVLRVGLIEMAVARQAAATEAPARPATGPHRTLAWGHPGLGTGAPSGRAAGAAPAPADSATSIPIYVATVPPSGAPTDPRASALTPPPVARTAPASPARPSVPATSHSRRDSKKPRVIALPAPPRLATRDDGGVRNRSEHSNKRPPPADPTAGQPTDLAAD